MSQTKATLLIRLTARIALFSLVFQLSAIGHWSLGPFHGEAGDITNHAAHCHGDVSGCAGESSLTGSLLEANLPPMAPAPTQEATHLTVLLPGDPFVALSHEPPRI